MVSLIELKSTYLQELNQKNEISDFIKFLFDSDVSINKISNPTNVPEIKRQALLCLLENDPDHFKSFYTTFEKRNPDSQTDWLYDQVFLFILICAVKKYSLDITWIKKAINIAQMGDEANKIKTTFINILNGNFESPDNIHSIVIVFLHITESKDLNQEIANNTYLDLSKKGFPFSTIEFLNIIGLKAIDLIIIKKNLLDPERTKILEGFHDRFLVRTQKAAKWIVNILLISTLVVSVYFIFKLYKDPENKTLNIILTVTSSIAGISLSSLFDLRRMVIDWITDIIRKIWGYQ